MKNGIMICGGLVSIVLTLLSGHVVDAQTRGGETSGHRLERSFYERHLIKYRPDIYALSEAEACIRSRDQLELTQDQVESINRIRSEIKALLVLKYGDIRKISGDIVERFRQPELLQAEMEGLFRRSADIHYKYQKEIFSRYMIFRDILTRAQQQRFREIYPEFELKPVDESHRALKD